MAPLFKNSRFYILLFALLLAVGIYVYAFNTVTTNALLIDKVLRLYALTSISFLYVALLIGPAVHIFPFLPYKGKIVWARRGVGVSAFFFGVLHASFAFFGQLGGFAALPFLPGKYLLAISLSATALLILTLMAATSFDYMVRKLTFRRWKFLHRFVYLAAFLIIIHALLIGSDFQDRSSPIFIVSFALLIFLLIVKALAWDKYLVITRPNFPRFVLTAITAGGLLFAFLIFVSSRLFHSW